MFDIDSLPEAIRQLIIPEPNSGCWLYDGNWDSGNGYGKKWWQGLAWQFHRLVWFLLVGPICPTFLLDHKCKVRCCCNPAHLDPCHNVVNTRRGNAKLFKRREDYGST
jgi:hypothetical protein